MRTLMRTSLLAAACALLVPALAAAQARSPYSVLSDPELPASLAPPAPPAPPAPIARPVARSQALRARGFEDGVAATGAPMGRVQQGPAPSAQPLVAPIFGKEWPALGADQTALLGIGKTFATRYVAEKNEIRMSDLRRARKGYLSPLIGKVVEWPVALDTLRTDSKGEIDQLWFALEPGSHPAAKVGRYESLFGISASIPQTIRTTLSFLEKGSVALVRMRFLAGEKDGLAELSLTEHGSMTEPEFIVEILSVRPLPVAQGTGR